MADPNVEAIIAAKEKYKNATSDAERKAAADSAKEYYAKLPKETADSLSKMNEKQARDAFPKDEPKPEPKASTAKAYDGFDSKEEHDSQAKKKDGTIVGQDKIDKSYIDPKTTPKNKVTVEYSDGTVETVTGYIKDGVTYDIDGNRLVDGGNGKGAYLKSDMESMKGVVPDKSTGYAFETTIKLNKPKNAVEEVYERPEREPKPDRPSKPGKVEFDEPKPTISSDIKIVNKYKYFFGLDKMNFYKKNINSTSCHITQEVNIGELKDGEYIQLEAKYFADENSSIEFYIIDGGLSIPIMPVSDKTVQFEKVFFGLRPRFSLDINQPINVYKNGVASEISIDQAIQLNDALYTVSYTPLNAYNCKPLNSTIKVKVIIRQYTKTPDIPYVEKMLVRKFGGDALWTQDISI